MVEVLELKGEDAARRGADRAVEVLEAGGLVWLPERAFRLRPAEHDLLDPNTLAEGSKNISLDPATGELRGAALQGDRREAMAAMIARFAAEAGALLAELVPTYVPALQLRRTSFRPGAVGERALSPRKDDRRLHVDAFPSNPTQGRRIFRVFANADPSGRERVWEIGEEGFEAHATRFRKRLTGRGLTAGLKQALGVTRARQSAYDQVMLQLHDAAKLDADYQATAPRRRIGFAPGGMWVVYTDGTAHAALSGQHAFEQTYLLPVEAMARPEQAPVRVLEKMLDRPLV